MIILFLNSVILSGDQWNAILILLVRRLSSASE